MKHRLLLVEDNPDDLALIQRAIEHFGNGVEAVVHSSTSMALEWLLESTAKAENMPDLILLDLKLPKIEGVGLMQRLRADSVTCHIPVVLFSSDIDDAAVSSCLVAGCNSYVRKPVRYADFMHTVEQIIQYWLQVHEAPLLQG